MIKPQIIKGFVNNAVKNALHVRSLMMKMLVILVKQVKPYSRMKFKKYVFKLRFYQLGQKQSKML